MIACHVCGMSLHEAKGLIRMNRTGKPGIWACEAHRGRQRCVIVGCKRTTAGKPGDEWMCGEHWRRYCPPRSPKRRVYHRFFRIARRHGWDKDLVKRHWRFWDGLVASANRLHALGYPDMTEINKLFGWEE